MGPVGKATLFAPGGRGRTALAYVAMLAATAGIYAFIRQKGMALPAPPAPASAAPPPGAGAEELFAHVLLALAGIMLAARATGVFFERVLRQPPVMGEIVAGILLGPSVLGAVWPAGLDFLLPSAVAPTLGVIAKLGVVLFMFLVGLETDGRMLRRHPHAVLAISHASIVVPFLLGAALALALYPIYGHRGMGFTVFSLFLGVSLSVTAFPVLARILTDRRVSSTPLGVTAIACAAVDDATAWCLLALVSGVATARTGDAGRTVLLVGAFVALMLIVVRPMARRLAAREEPRKGPLSLTVLAAVFAALLLSALATETIGIHALFGAFLFGAVLPHEGRLADQLRVRMEDLVVVLLLPVFFAFTGLRTHIGLVSTAGEWAIVGLIVLAATAGKFGGSFVAAKLSGLGWRESSALGILMNTRGLMELIVLHVGLDMGVLSPTLFTMLVIMALVTTFSTTPVLNLLYRRHAFAGAPEGLAERV